MKSLWALAAVAFVTGCGSTATPSPVNANAETVSGGAEKVGTVRPSSQYATLQRGGSNHGEITVEWLAGDWADTPDCHQRITFRRDGTFVMTGGASGTYRIENNRTVVITGQSSVQRLNIVPDTDNHVFDDHGGESFRCLSA